jgi:hypothetical protein
MDEKRSRRLKEVWPYLALLVLVVLPLLVMAAALALRYDMFDVSGEKPDTEVVQVFLTFIAGGLATAATVFGALLTRQHNQRAEHRLRLETVAKELDHLPEGRARTAGSIATMVLLGEQSVAMRVLEPAWSDHEVDDATATWLIGQVLCDLEKDETAIDEAATLLRAHAKDLTIAGRPGYFNFPGSLMHGWRPDLPPGAKEDVLLAMADTLISQDLSWWPNKPPAWPARSLVRCVVDDPDESTARCACVLLAVLYDAFPAQIGALMTAVERRKIDVVRAATERPNAVPDKFRKMADRLRKWSGTTPAGAGIPAARDAGLFTPRAAG